MQGKDTERQQDLYRMLHTEWGIDGCHEEEENGDSQTIEPEEDEPKRASPLWQWDNGRESGVERRQWSDVMHVTDSL